MDKSITNAEDQRWRKSESQKREDAGAPKGREVAKHCVFPAFCGSGGSTSRLAKAAGAEPARQVKDVQNSSISRSENSARFASTAHWPTTGRGLLASRGCHSLW